MIQQAAHLAMSEDARVERKRSRAVLPCTLADDAALSLVRASMEGMAEAIEHLADVGVKDAEGVHQVRVSTRRAEAAMLAFRGVIEEASERRVRKQLSEVRRCAGKVRKCDVQSELLAGLLESAGGDERVVIAGMLGRLKKKRRRAVADFEAMVSGRARRKLARAASRLTLREGRAADQTLEDVAERALPARAADMDVLCRSSSPSAEELHDLRIAGKRARYVLEVVGLCVEANAFGEMYRRMEQFQELLGAYNDDHELGLFLEKSALKRRKLARKSGIDADRVDAAIESLRHAVESRGAQRRAAFMAWWSGEDARKLINALMSMGRQERPAMIIEPSGNAGRHIAC